MNGWQTVRRIDFRSLHQARLQAHYGAQWLARAARAYLPKQRDDAQASLGWDAEFGGMTTHPLPGGARIGLRLADFTISVLRNGASQTLELDGRAEPEVRTWLGRQLEDGGLAPAKLDDPAPYDMPSHVIATGARYSLEELGDSFQALAIWYGNAHLLLARVQQKLATRNLNASPVRCWPQHFDLDSFVSLGQGRTTALGFSPGDEHCDEPHFYASMLPEPAIPTLPLLPPLGHWHTHRFVAAFAPAHKIVAAGDQAADAEVFFDVAMGAALRPRR